MKNAVTEQEKRAVIGLMTAIVETVKEAGKLGAPGGVMYAALMAHGCTLDQFNTIMQVLVNVGKLRRSGNLYFAA